MQSLKVPLLFAEGGEKEEKAGAKNEKAITYSTKIKKNVNIELSYFYKYLYLTTNPRKSSKSNKKFKPDNHLSTAQINSS